ncbi:DNA topoisomerase III [Thiotrichales bacterium 19S3-7]|nr:DNA topoisomerase III [Thiotrichales bacterium 19S3-7]MCF6802408.1 DNA topoisomerase III [Thiotrichales bacterium 19S3-11]
MKVFIAEKPSQGRDIASVLGCNQRYDGYLSNADTIVTWGFGHLLQPADPVSYDEKYKRWDMKDLPIIPERWKLAPNPKSKAQLKIVNSCIKLATEIIIATDADREGELIARLIISKSGYKGIIKRLWLSALDDASIKTALSRLKDGSETEPLFWAGLGRQRADWICGLSYTRAATLILGSGVNLFSIGRVQTPTVRLVVERDLEIENFKSKPFYTVTANVIQGQLMSEFDWVIPEYAKGDDDSRCLDRKFAKAVIDKCQNKSGIIQSLEKKKKARKAPLALSLSELQKLANTKYGLSAQDTLNCAQALYEKYKATTYPRTDCGYLNMEQHNDAKTIFNSLSSIDKQYDSLIKQCDPSFKSRCWSDKKVSESAHHAIIPTTNTKVNISMMSIGEKQVYDLIVRYYLAQFMGDFIYDETIIHVECLDEEFVTKGMLIIESGWKQAFTKEDDEDKDAKSLPAFNKNDSVLLERLELHNKKTTPPQHYTEATLISAMKNCGRRMDDEAAKSILTTVKGIGTEATRANIIEIIKKREYIDTKGKSKSLISTEKARELIKILPEEITGIEMTADWELELDKIAKGLSDFKDFMKRIAIAAHQGVQAIADLKGKGNIPIKNPCPKCGAELRRIKSTKGKGFWWGCTQFRNGCRVVLEDKRGKPVLMSDKKPNK